MEPLELVLFETDPTRATEARAQGISSFIFDVETLGKVDRQHAFDTQISATSLGELSNFVATSQIRPLCRLDPWHEGSELNIEQAIASGAGELIFPMVRTVAEVEHILSAVAGRVPTGIMIETREVLDFVPEISRMPLSRAYVGLNDLMISRGNSFLFEPLIDGTVDRIRNEIGAIRFGVAGATRVDKGFPIPSRLLFSELARLDVHFTMLRRAFRRDVVPHKIADAIRDIAKLWQALGARTQSEISRDRAEFTAIVSGLARKSA